MVSKELAERQGRTCLSFLLSSFYASPSFKYSSIMWENDITGKISKKKNFKPNFDLI